MLSLWPTLITIAWKTKTCFLLFHAISRSADVRLKKCFSANLTNTKFVCLPWIFYENMLTLLALLKLASLPCMVNVKSLFSFSFFFKLPTCWLIFLRTSLKTYFLWSNNPGIVSNQAVLYLHVKWWMNLIYPELCLKLIFVDINLHLCVWHYTNHTI